jgi:hypothetical protein
MILYHGTTRQSLRGIVADGRLRGPAYLTDSLDVANYFAAHHRQGATSECVILEVNVDADQLGSDIFSLLEPIPLVQTRLGIKNKADEMAYLEEIAGFNGESWIDMLGEKAGINGKKHWELSLALGHAVLHREHIKISAIKVVSHAT